MIKPLFAVRLEQLINKNNLPMRKLVKESGISYQIIYRMLNGKVKNPRAKAIHKLAKALKSTYSYIMEGKGYSEVENPFDKKIPILSLNETYEWCKNNVRKIADTDREYIRNPISEERNDYFAIKILTDAMEGKECKGLPKGSIAICKPKENIETDKYLLFYDIYKKNALMREAVIEDKVYLKPLNPYYALKETYDNLKVIAEVVGVINLFNNF